MKRIVCLFVLLFTLLPLCFVTAGAEIYSGGALNREWILEDVSGREMTPDEIEAIALAAHYRVEYELDTEKGELRIFCGKDEQGNKLEQAMLPYAHYMWIPWQSLGVMNTIKTAYIEEGVLSVGRYSFYHCESIEEVYIPHSVRKIDRTTFYQCKNLEKVYYAGNEDDFWKRINLDEVRNWYAVDADGDGLENTDEIKEYFKDKIVYGESVKVVCKNEEGDEIDSFTIGGYRSGEAYSFDVPEIEGITYTGEQTAFEGKFKRNDSTVYELIYHCDHEYAVKDPAKPCGSFCKKCGRQNPEPPAEHEWDSVEVRSERGFLTPLDQSVKCKICGTKVREYKGPLAPIICIAVATPILVAGLVCAIVYPIRKKRKMKELTW